MDRLFSARYSAIIAIILFAALSRLLPHPPNFTAIGAMALFAGAFLPLAIAWLVPVIAMLISDLVINNVLYAEFYGQFVWVSPSAAWTMLAVALITVLGSQLLAKVSVLRLFGASLSASLLFFLVSNIGPWLSMEIYPNTVSGLIAAYIAAIPFFGNTIAGDLFFCAILFGGFALLSSRWRSLRAAA
ncbi:MAG: hypothetical protein JKY90_03255 [Gammaproteobacteria bacterium]|nr:hypothetical protein [Gammaproteobacteria bacterium]